MKCVIEGFLVLIDEILREIIEFLKTAFEEYFGRIVNFIFFGCLLRTTPNILLSVENNFEEFEKV